MNSAASLTLKWYTCLGRTMSWLTHCHDILIWLLLLLALMTRRGQPVCCSAYVMLSCRPLVMSGVLSWKKHALEMAGLLCMMVWYVAHCMVKKWHLWYLIMVT